MATGKVLNAANSSFSLSASFKSIFSCCFVSSSSSNNSAKEGEREKKKEEEEEEAVGQTRRRAAGERVNAGDKDAGKEIRVGGKKEELGQKNGIRDLSEQDSAVFDDSAIDSVSLNSQFNLRGSVDDEAMKTSDNLEPYEESSHYGDQNDNVADQDATQVEQESNDDVIDDDQAPAFASVERLEAGEGEGVEEETEGDEVEADANLPSFPDTEIDRLEPGAGKLEDATSANDNADRAHPPVIECGRVRMTVAYDPGHQRLTLTVHEASDIPEHDRVNLSHSQVHLLLLPATKKIRHRTKAKTGENPQFEETFRAKIPMDELQENGFRLRLYRTERFKKERMIGEKYVDFSRIPLDRGATYSTWVKLQPRININLIGNPASDDAAEMGRDDADGGTASSMPTSAAAAAATLSSGPPLELMLGLAYNATTGRLSVEVVQGCNIKSPDSQKPPDTYVKLRLIAPSGQEIARSKTTLRRNQPNPLYKETFMFHVPEFQLPDVSLMISVFERRNIKHNKMLGWFTLGHTNSTEETRRHWMAMIESKGEQNARWHALLNP